MSTAVLRRARLYLVAALACALTLRGFAHLRPAHAAPADVTTALTLGLSGPRDAMVGRTATYTLSATADPTGADAAPLEYSIAFPRAVIGIVSFADADATCVDFANNSDVGVVCEQDRLAAGQTVTLAVTVSFTGVSNGALIPAQAKAANSAFSYTDGGVKIVPQAQPPAHLRPVGFLPALPDQPVAAP
jgi:hypothetical protein